MHTLTRGITFAALTFVAAWRQRFRIARGRR